MDVVLQFTSLNQEDVQVLSQRHCTLTSYVDALNPEKLVFLKNLEVYAKMLGLETVEDVLLVDDGPQKNLLNDVHSAIHPRPGPVMMMIGSSPLSFNLGWRVFSDQVYPSQSM